MKRILPFVLLLTACPDPSNPDRLWVARGENSAVLSLSDEEPDPF